MIDMKRIKVGDLIEPEDGEKFIGSLVLTEPDEIGELLGVRKEIPSHIFDKDELMAKFEDLVNSLRGEK